MAPRSPLATPPPSEFPSPASSSSYSGRSSAPPSPSPPPLPSVRFPLRRSTPLNHNPRSTSPSPSSSREAAPLSVLLRARRTSLPNSVTLAQTNYHSTVVFGATSAQGAVGGNRMSVASCESLIEEEEGSGAELEEGTPSTAAAPAARLRRESRTGYERKVSATSWGGGLHHRLSIVERQRYSLPPPPPLPSTADSSSPGSSVPNSVASSQSSHALSTSFGGRGGGGISRSSSPLGRSLDESLANPMSDRARRNNRRKSRPVTDLQVEQGKEQERERIKREDRRWRIALELRDTERSYVATLVEIDKEYYQPLLAALPPSERKVSGRSPSLPPASPHSAPGSPSLGPISSYLPFFNSTPISSTATSTRPASTSSSSSSAPVTLASSTTSIASSSLTPVSTPASTPILSRKSITEIFSNFSAVLDVSKVVLSTLENEVPNKPSDPVSISISKGSKFVQRHLEDSDSSVGPVTPEDFQRRGVLGGQGRVIFSESPLSSSPRSTVMESPKSSEPSFSPTRRIPAQPVRLGKVLLPLLPFLKTYAPFVSNFSATLSRLAMLESNQSFIPPSPNSSNSSEGTTTAVLMEERERWQRFCEERKKRGVGKGLGLSALLLGLVQRVPRYRFMLENLLEFTDKEHPDWKDLNAAFQLVDQVATHLDTQIQSHTHELYIINLQRSFTNLDSRLVSPGRRLLKSGLLRKLDRRGNDQLSTFFLFNDIIIHASGGDVTSLTRPLSAGGEMSVRSTGVQQHKNRASQAGSGGAAPFTPSSGGGAVQYRFHRRFALGDVTVVDSQDSMDSGRKFGFELRSSDKSYALFADSAAEKLDWIEGIRLAISELMRDRRTLQRDHDYSEPRIPSQKIRQRHLSLPGSSSASAAIHAVLQHSLPTPPPEVLVPPIAKHHSSLPPPLEYISPTSPELNRPLSDIRASPVELDPEFNFSLLEAGIPPSHSSTAPPTSLEPELDLQLREGEDLSSRSRRWSDMSPSAAAQALSDAILHSEELQAVNGGPKVIENYSAPVWVPDSKAERCMRCSSPFGVLRRRHHCRICGAVVCWSCSTKTFIIPSYEGGEGRLARACDFCYDSVFPAAPPDNSLHYFPQHYTLDGDDQGDMLPPEETEQIDCVPPEGEVPPSAIVAQLNSLLGKSRR